MVYFIVCRKVYKSLKRKTIVSVKFVIHNRLDNVGVAIDDIRAGEEVAGVYIEDRSSGPRLKAINDVPLGHKIALTNIRAGEKVIKYGRVIGVAISDIRAGVFWRRGDDHGEVHSKGLR